MVKFPPSRRSFEVLSWFYQALYCYFSLSQVKLLLFRPLTHCVRILASFEGRMPFASFPGWGICTPLPHSGVFVWICWPHCWTIAAFLRKKITNARGELELTEPLHYCCSFALRIGFAAWWPILTPKNNLPYRSEKYKIILYLVLSFRLFIKFERGPWV